ncbi:hypothetical protein [Mesorhizobium sp. 43Arga]
MFQNSDDIQILTVPREPRRYLILIRAGSKRRPSLFSEPLSERREYDVGINYYADPHPDDAFRTGAELIFGGGLSKMHGAKRLFEATGLHNIYEGVFFLDDDVEILFDPDEFFKLCEEYFLDIAQPSLTSDSSCVIPLTRHHPGLILRTTNWVEVMAPFFRRDFLREMLHSFDLSISGWGLDIYWGHHLKERWRAGIVDNFLIRHANECKPESGPFYDYLKGIGIDPSGEMKSILTLIDTNPYVVRPIQFIYHTYFFRA